MWPSAVLLLALLLVGCAQEEPAAVPVLDVRAPVAVVEWALPTLRAGTHSPGLAATGDGRLLLSWVNSQRGRRHVLQFSAYDIAHQRWRGAPLTVVIGNSLARVQGESPQMLASRDGALWAQWLQRAGANDVDVMFSRSRDGGANWSEPQMPYEQRTYSEQRATLLWAEGERGISLAWLDDGNTLEGVSLRTSRADAGGAPAGEQALDIAVSFCARPAAAMTSRGPLLAYRGNGEGDERDHFSVIGRDGQGWTPPVRVHTEDAAYRDCLVITGPVLGAHAEDAVLAWFSHDAPKVIQMAHSNDAGGHFSAPVALYRGEDAGAPLAVALDAQQVWVLWEKMADNQQCDLWLSRYSQDLQQPYEHREIVDAAGGYSCSTDMGEPRLAVVQGIGHLVWVERGAAGTSLRGVKLLPSR